MSAMLPFRSRDQFHKYRTELVSMSATQLANLVASTSVQDATVVWIFSLTSRFAAASNLNMQLEVLESMGKVVSNWDKLQISFIPNEFSSLLDTISAINLPQKLRVTRAFLLYELAQKLSSKSKKTLTIAHIHLAAALDSDMRRYSAPLFGLPLTYDARYGNFEGSALCNYFTKVTDLMTDWKEWGCASIHAKCAIATCGRQAPLPRLYVKATIIQFIAHKKYSPAVPGFITQVIDFNTNTLNIKPLIQEFEGVALVPSLRETKFNEIAQEVCTRYDLLNILEPLVDAYKISWLEALHKTMPQCTKEQVDHSGPEGFDYQLLKRGYNATLTDMGEYQVFEAATPKIDSWVTLETVLKVTKRLAKVQGLVAPNLFSRADEQHEQHDQHAQEEYA